MSPCSCSRAASSSCKEVGIAARTCRVRVRVRVKVRVRVRVSVRVRAKEVGIAARP